MGAVKSWQLVPGYETPHSTSYSQDQECGSWADPACHVLREHTRKGFQLYSSEPTAESYLNSQVSYCLMPFVFPGY
jgi:hypothetical protein